MNPNLRSDKPSAENPAHVHRAGTPVVLLEPLDPDKSVWLVEVRVPDDTLVGGAWFDCIEARLDDLAFDAELQSDIEAANQALEEGGEVLGFDAALEEMQKGAPPKKVAA